MRIATRFDVNHKPIHLQKILTDADAAFDLSDIRLFDYESEEDYQKWCEIVNAAYAEEDYVPQRAKKLLTEHPFLQNAQTFFYLDKDDCPIGTISIGAYRDCPDVAGDFRLAVMPGLQNMGIGGRMLRFANHEMYLKGFRKAESIISYKRDTSLYLHYKCGYFPQDDIRKWALKSNFFN